MGGDIERFGLYARGGLDGVAAVYVKDNRHIAIGMMREPVQTPDWAGGVPRLADPVAEMLALRRGDVVAIVGGIAFYRRGGVGQAGLLGYQRFVARLGDDLVIDVISDADEADVERLLARIDGAALAAQLTNPELAPDATSGVVLHHWPETWPEASPVPEADI
jgi:hypothetical protein